MKFKNIIQRYTMDFLPGLCQGMTRVMISYPFDYAKVQLQKDKYINTRDFMKNYFKHNSPLSLYRGCRLPLTIVSLDRSIQYKYYEDLNKVLNPYLSGISIGVISSVYNVPMQYVNSHVILDPKKTSMGFIRETLSTQGLKGFYKGSGVETLRNVAGGGLYMGTYGTIRDRIGNGGPQAILAAGLSSWVNWTVLYPLDLIRTQYQTTKSVSIPQIIRNQTRNNVLGLWKGILPIYMRTFPSACTGMYVYEKVRNWTAESPK